jgi:hypothetical protein
MKAKGCCPATGNAMLRRNGPWGWDTTEDCNGCHTVRILPDLVLRAKVTRVTRQCCRFKMEIRLLLSSLSHEANKTRKCYSCRMDENRKRVLRIAASIVGAPSAVQPISDTRANACLQRASAASW